MKPSLLLTRKTWLLFASVIVALAAATSVLSRSTVSKSTKSPPSVSIIVPAVPKITWSQPQIQAFLSPGDSLSRTASFTSDSALSNVSIEPVPEIAPFLALQPSTIESVPDGQAQAILLTFSIPPGTRVGVFQGTVHIRGGGRTLPETLKITINVLSYTSPDLGLGFNLPDFARPTNVIKSQFPDGTMRLDVELQTNAQQDALPAFRLIVYNNPNGLNLLQWFHSNIDVNDLLVGAGAFQQRRLTNGLLAMVRSGPIPDQYLETNGPVEEAFLISSAGDKVVGIVQSQDNILDSLGYSQVAIQDLLVSVLGTLQFF